MNNHPQRSRTNRVASVGDALTQADIDTIDHWVAIAISDFEKLFSPDELDALAVELDQIARAEYSSEQCGSIVFLDVPEEWTERLEERKRAALHASIAASSDRGNAAAIASSLRVMAGRAYLRAATDAQIKYLAKLLADRNLSSDDMPNPLTGKQASFYIDQLKSEGAK